MRPIAIYAPHRWSTVHLLRRALRELGVPTKVIRHHEVNNEGDDELSRRVNWGGVYPYGAALNSTLSLNKFAELTKIRGARVPTLEFFAGPNPPGRIGSQPGEWLARSLHHRAAADLRGVHRATEGHAHDGVQGDGLHDVRRRVRPPAGCHQAGRRETLPVHRGARLVLRRDRERGPVPFHGAT